MHLLNEGLKAYEAKDDAARTISLTLLSCFPLRICVTQEMLDYSQTEKGSQCLGKHSFRYAVMPHTGDWEKAKLWQAAERFNLNFIAAQTGPTKHGTEPLSKSFLEIKPDNLHVSAVKRSENGQGWIVRLFNPFEEAVSASIRLNDGLADPAFNVFTRGTYQKGIYSSRMTKAQKWSSVRISITGRNSRAGFENGFQGMGGF